MYKEFTFFWKGPFSQWKASIFRQANGTVYCCAEQYMMYQKALLFNDQEQAKKIMTTKKPSEQQAWGRSVNYEPHIGS